MKYYRLLILFVILCIGLGASADNIIRLSSVQGAPGEEVTVSISLDNSNAVSSMQVSIPLAEGISYVDGSGVLGSRCSSHSLTIGAKDGLLNVLVYSMGMSAITGNSGEVASFKLKLGSQPETITLSPTKTVLTNTAGNTITCSAGNGNVIIVSGKAEYSQTEIDFGRVPILSSYQETLTVTNVGNADLTINGLLFSDVNVFSSTTSFPITINAGESKQLNITYSPVERGSIEKTVKVDCNSSSKLNTIKLKAQPFAVNELYIQPASGISDEEVTVRMTMNNMDPISGYQIEFTMPEQLQFVEGSFTISNRKVDHVAAASVNNGKVRFIVYSPSDKALTGNDGEIGSFKVKLVGRNSVELTPTKTVLSATIKNKVENVVSDVYGGLITISSPTISTDDNVDFGAVSITEDAEKTLTVWNYGSAPLTINKVEFNNQHLSIKESLPITVDASGNKNLTVVYNSLEQTNFDATMRIYSNDPDLRMKEVRVVGSRFAPNYLEISTADIFPHENLSIDLALNTYDPIMGLQFDLEYPGQYYEAFDNNYTLESRAEGMTVTTRQMDNNTLRVFCYFLSGNGIAAGNSKIMSLLLKPKSDNIPQATYSVKIKNIIFSAENLTDKYAGTDTQCSFVVLDGSLVTITAKSVSRQYGSENPTFEYEATGAQLYGVPDLTCEASAASNAGSYSIVASQGTIRNKNVTFVNGTLTITSKVVDSPTIILSATSYTYDGNGKEPTVTVKDGGTTIPASEYSVSYTNNINVGTATVTITDAEGGNYAVSGSTTFVITSSDGSLTPPNGKSNLVYNGTAQNLITAGSSTTGTVKYSLDGTTYNTAIPQGTAAGKYTVYYKVEGDANHNDVAAQSFDVTIAAKTVDNPTITLSATSYTYDGTAKEPTVTVKDGSTTIPASEYSVSYTNNINVGTATVTITDAEGGNYVVSGSTTFAISSADGSLSPPVGKSDLVYNGAAQNLITAGSSTTGTVKYSLDGTTYSTTIPQGTAAGKYTVYYKVEGDANHNDVAALSFDVTIAAKTVDNPTITLSATSYTYDGTAKEPTVSLKDGDTTIPASEYSVSYTNNINVGTATVTITDAEGGNYAVSGSTTFVITSSDGSLTPPNGKSNLVYNGTAQNLITAGSSTTGTVKYSLDGATYNTTIPQGTDAGKYTVYYKVEGDANHNDVAAQSFDVTIAKALLKVSVGEYTITEGDDIPTFTISYDGFKNNETANVLTTVPTITCTATKGSKAGEYDITISGGEAKNYEFSYTAGKLTIMPKEFDENIEGVNGNEDDVVTYTITNTSEGTGEGETPTVAISNGSNVSGECAIPETVTHSGKTYAVTAIAENAFLNNTNLTDVTIPVSIETIGDNAFSGCSGLKSITVLNETPIVFSSPAQARRIMTRGGGSSIFEGVDKETCILYVPEGSVDKYKAAEVWKEFKNILPIGSTGIGAVLNTEGDVFDIYNLNGRKVKAKAKSLDGLPKGVYIVNGSKFIVK